jgi:hypothetical protein
LALVEEMLRVGANPSAPTDISHAFTFESASGAHAAAGRLSEFGYEPRVDRFDDVWFMFAGEEIVPVPLHLARVRDAMHAIASACGGTYDGWDAAIRTDSWPDCGCTWPEGPGKP